MSRSVCWVVGSLLFLPSIAAAEIVAVNGNGVDQGTAAGMNLDNGYTENTLVQGFDELQDVVVTKPTVTVDHLVGDNLNVGDEFRGKLNFAAEDGRQLPPGVYDSHLIHFDPQGSSGIVYEATFTFDKPIVGIIKSNSGDARLLNASDGTFGNAARYDTSAQRRADGGGGLDIFTLVAPNQLHVVQMKAGSGLLDNVRVLTAAPDSDGDGVNDDKDNCVQIANPEQLTYSAGIDYDTNDQVESNGALYQCTARHGEVCGLSTFAPGLVDQRRWSRFWDYVGECNAQTE